MKEEIIHIIFNYGIPVILTGILGFLGKIVKDNNAMKKSQLSLIRSQIVGKCEIYSTQGYLPEYARYCLEDLFEQYKILGGNHGIEKLVENCFELPPIKEESDINGNNSSNSNICNNPGCRRNNESN